jgi:phage portal protein BeeE
LGILDKVAAARGGASRDGVPSVTTLDDYAALLNQFVFNGNAYMLGGLQTTTPGEKAERIPNSLEGFAQKAYASNGVVFSVMAVRQLVFSTTRFAYQRFERGRPDRLFGDSSLRLLEEPWVGGTTQDLLARMIQDNDLAGNFYGVIDTPLVKLDTQDGQEIVRLRPDWVDIVLAERMIRGAQVGWRRVGYVYYEGGRHSGNDPAVFVPEEVAHFAVHPDPLASYRGMSWLTPIIREIQGDDLMTRHKLTFFENGATPNLVVKGIPAINKTEFDKIVDAMEERHAGLGNAYRTLYLTAGADATVVGANMEQLDFKQIQGFGETRIANAGGVPAVIVGLSESMQGSSLTTGNYGQARRRLADGTMHPLWANAAGSLQRIVKRPSGSRLWYDVKDVPFLREDEKDAADIQGIESRTIRTLLDAGFTAESVKAAVLARDWSLLEHSGLFSVQLQPPGSSDPAEPPVRLQIRTAAELADLITRGWTPVPTTDDIQLDRLDFDIELDDVDRAIAGRGSDT